MIPPQVRRGELDEQSGYRILDYIYDVKGKLILDENDMRKVAEKKQQLASQKPVDYTQDRAQFYVPDHVSSPNVSRNTTTTSLGSKSFGDIVSEGMDTLSDRVRFKTMNNVRRINKNVLLYNGLTVALLVGRCRVSITSLKQANIVNSFEDLVEIGFKPLDLLIDRALFSHTTLTQVFGTYHQQMKACGVEITLGDLLVNKSFPTSELINLKFTLADMIEARVLKRGQFRDLRFPISELVQLGLKKKHLGQEFLNIDQGFATKPRQQDGNGGMGWTQFEFEHVLV